MPGKSIAGDNSIHGPSRRLLLEHVQEFMDPSGTGFPRLSEVFQNEQILKLVAEIGNAMRIVGGKTWEHFDGVPCLLCPLWPAEAQTFITRNRSESNWPPEDLVRNIVGDGCHAVKVGAF